MSIITRGAFTLTIVLLPAFGCRQQTDTRKADPSPQPRQAFTFIEHKTPAGVTVPAGMVYVLGGVTRIGSEEGASFERPTFEVEVKPFFLDVHPVTVAEFARFVKATGYQTQAEKFGSSGVFENANPQWTMTDGANWRYPRGPAKPPAPPDHPVTQVSWNDAIAYCNWIGKRLPTEAEWEHAARNAQNGGPRYAWGDELVVNGVFMANTWQGHFPAENTAEDGYEYTAPVGLTGRSPLGLTDMGGNVWQWCEDWYRPYERRQEPFTPDENSEKVLRGGSFLCDPKVCHGFRVSARSSSTPETGLNHMGFRCAMDLPAR
jgi:sulfatase modifying factor 1